MNVAPVKPFLFILIPVVALLSIIIAISDRRPAQVVTVMGGTRIGSGMNGKVTLEEPGIKTNEVKWDSITITNTSTYTNVWLYQDQTNFMTYMGDVVTIGEFKPPWQHPVHFYHFTEDQWRLLTNYFGLSTNQMDRKLMFYGPTNRIPK